MTRLLLVRHGETDWNRERRWQGQQDVPLNERGREQARDLAERLAGEPVAAVVSSDLARARETAEIVAARLGLRVETDERLRELRFGRWEGLTTGEIEARFPAEIEAFRSGGDGHGAWGGESYAELCERVVAAVEDAVRRHPGETVLLVFHGGPIRALLAHAAGITYGEQRARREHVENCEVVELEARDGSLVAG